MAYGNAERFRRILSGEPVDRTPIIEWVPWWDKTVDVWRSQGLPSTDPEAINAFWGLDPLTRFWPAIRSPECPQPTSFGGAIISSSEEYHRIKKHLYTNRLLEEFEESLASYTAAHQGEDIAYWFSFDGFFWYPRTLFGIEGHLFAFYDEPDLMLEINRDVLEWHLKCLPVIYRYIDPLFMTITEDMSYNHGPMISREQYDRFMLPFYRELVPEIRKHGTRVLIDSDGQVEPLIPWFLDGGIEGILPLERMAGVDVNRLRRDYPDFIMIGGFDKTVMHLGEEAIRAEFERILPAIRSGRFIPSVDHQTPPAVSMDDYRLYLRLLREYSAKV